MDQTRHAYPKLPTIGFWLAAVHGPTLAQLLQLLTLCQTAQLHLPSIPAAHVSFVAMQQTISCAIQPKIQLVAKPSALPHNFRTTSQQEKAACCCCSASTASASRLADQHVLQSACVL
jgi:hypothetical protein